MLSFVRGYNVYKDIWEAACTIGENHSCWKELNNRRNPFAITVPDYKITMGIIVPRRNFTGKYIPRFCKEPQKLRNLYACVPTKFSCSIVLFLSVDVDC